MPVAPEKESEKYEVRSHRQAGRFPCYSASREHPESRPPPTFFSSHPVSPLMTLNSSESTFPPKTTDYPSSLCAGWSYFGLRPFKMLLLNYDQETQSLKNKSLPICLVICGKYVSPNRLCHSISISSHSVFDDLFFKKRNSTIIYLPFGIIHRYPLPLFLQIELIYVDSFWENSHVRKHCFF